MTKLSIKSRHDTRWNSTTPVEIGRMSYNQNYFDGVMSIFIGSGCTQYAASNFGSFDSTTGELIQTVQATDASSLR